MINLLLRNIVKYSKRIISQIRVRANIVPTTKYANESVIHAKSTVKLGHTQFCRIGSRITRSSMKFGIVERHTQTERRIFTRI